MWTSDVSKNLQNDKLFEQVYNDGDFNTIVTAYFPTKVNSV